jgi:hypothetical protein
LTAPIALNNFFPSKRWLFDIHNSPIWAEALGAEGRAEIRQATERALQAAPRSGGVRDWRADAQRRHLAFRLALLADLDDDVDAFIAAIRIGDMEATHSLDVAERLLSAGRAAEALEWLDKPRRHHGDEDERDPGVDLRIAAFEALGRKDEAQAARWRHFEQWLSAEHLRDYLKRLPDFEDFDAEQKALAVAGAHLHAAWGPAFLVEWRALDRAERLVRDRLADLDGRRYDLLRPAAEALESKYPEAASLMYRCMVESVLGRGSSKQYVYAARDLAAGTRLAAYLPQPGSIESHADFLARLRKSHGRKYGFWELVEGRGV